MKPETSLQKKQQKSSTTSSNERWHQKMFRPWKKEKKLLYFEWSPPWHVGWGLSGEGCHLDILTFLWHFTTSKPAILFFWIFAWSCRVLSATQDRTCHKCSNKQDTTICENMSIYHLAETNMPKHAKTWQWTTWSIFGTQTCQNMSADRLSEVFEPTVQTQSITSPVRSVWANMTKSIAAHY